MRQRRRGGGRKGRLADTADRLVFIVHPILRASLHLRQHLVLAHGLKLDVAWSLKTRSQGQKVVAPVVLDSVSGEIEQRRVRLTEPFPEILDRLAQF